MYCASYWLASLPMSGSIHVWFTSQAGIHVSSDDSASPPRCCNGASCAKLGMAHKNEYTPPRWILARGSYFGLLENPAHIKVICRSVNAGSARNIGLQLSMNSSWTDCASFWNLPHPESRNLWFLNQPNFGVVGKQWPSVFKENNSNISRVSPTSHFHVFDIHGGNMAV